MIDHIFEEGCCIRCADKDCIHCDKDFCLCNDCTKGDCYKYKNRRIILDEFNNLKLQCQGFDIEILEMYRDALLKKFKGLV